MKQEITQEYLKSILEYNPDTGDFVKLKNGYPMGWSNNCGYVCIRIDRKTYQGHRLAWMYMTGRWPKECIDHINRTTGDNRWSNLREASTSENLRNRPATSRNKSGYKGVSWSKSAQKWVAQIVIDDEAGDKKTRQIVLGYFNNKIKASNAYKEACLKHHGKFANTG